jgi:hypothetical protein
MDYNNLSPSESQKAKRREAGKFLALNNLENKDAFVKQPKA